MALLNTVGTVLIPFQDEDPNALTRIKGTLLQTTAAVITQGAVNIFASATSENDFHLVSLVVNVEAGTAATLFAAYLGLTKIMELPTGPVAHASVSFGMGGLRGGTTTTGTVSLVVSGGTCTARYIATGIRR